MLARGLLVAHDVILTFSSQLLHNVVKNTKFHMVETFSGGSLVNIGQLVVSKGLWEEFLSDFLLPQVVFVTALFQFNVCVHNTCKSA